MTTIQKMIFKDGSVKFTYKMSDGKPRTVEQIVSDGKAGVKYEGRQGEVYDYLDRDMLDSAPVVYEAPNRSQADKVKRILSDYEASMGTKVLDHK